MLRDPSLIPLSHQHQHGLALCVAVRRSIEGDRSPENLARWAREVAATYETELANHFAIEEQVLFPLCPALPMVAELIAEHRVLEGMVAQLRDTASAGLLERFCVLLTSHIRREENKLFQEIQRTLPREELDRAGAKIQAQAIFRTL